ncbi:M20 family metallopeptidase [Sciscionella sediminilitoris]|uniref:M20 family metallopeptidase n=1 Tax=Sciscionella sediminilitoris TaxID=1445613 RepID=UPI0004DF30F3|nr:M20 family metallopeptidase [Sciscionella sp. SE31]
MIEVASVHDWLAGHRDELVADLGAYVGHESPSGDPALLAVTLNWLERWIGERLGTASRRELVPGGEHGSVLVLDFPGDGAAPVVLLGHYDTVWPEGTLAQWPYTVDGDTASGPGTFDMKAGLVQAVWALRSLARNGYTMPPIRIVLNGDEEIGSPVSRPVIERECADAAAVLVFEGSAAGSVKTARKGVGIFELTVAGREAHAGLDPEKGASAVDELARATLTLHALTDLGAGTSVNVGLVHGGTASNVVAGNAAATVDVRVRSRTEQDRIASALAGLRTADPRAEITVRGEWNRPVMERSAAAGQLAELANRAGAELGLDIGECAVGGASDGNFVAALGIPVLDGIGAVGDGAHARHEHVSIAAMTERAAVAAAVIVEFTGNLGGAL